MINEQAKKHQNNAVISVDGVSYEMFLPHSGVDYIQSYICKNNSPYELQMLEDIRSRVSKDDLVLDIGANVGNHTLYLAAVAHCRVIAFEPNPTLVNAIEKSRGLNDMDDRIQVFQVGVGAAAGHAKFGYLDQKNLGALNLELTSDKHAPVKVVALDDQSFPDCVKVIKIDVEGMELDVLKGAEGLLKKDFPVIYVECQAESDFTRVYDWLISIGYLFVNTFNATPTHLFLPATTEGGFQLQSNCLYKNICDKYRSDILENELRRKLDDSAKKYRIANEQIEQLKNKISENKFHVPDASEEKNYKIYKDIHLSKEKKELDWDVDEAGFKLDEVIDSVDQQKKEIAFGNKTILDLQRALLDVNEKYIFELEENKKLRTFSNFMEAHESEKVLLKEKLDQANKKYRQVTGEEVPTLKRWLSDKSCELQRVEKKLQEIERKYAESESRRLATEKRLLALRASLTFKVGYLISQHSRSLAGMLKLPVGLWQLYRQGRRQIKKRGDKNSKQLNEILKSNRLEISKKSNVNFVAPQPLVTNKTASDVKSILLPLQIKEEQKKIACIMDDFTYGCYQPECQLKQLTPQAWEEELKSFKPELLIIESAWRGVDELWGSKVSHQSHELKGVVAWCKQSDVPTIFWNKEDPVHFETFLNTAKLFDYVFSTDVDCIHRYKAALGHERVYLLPFACQPVIHNPVEIYHRKEAFSFAGAYYARYPDRTTDLEEFVSTLPSFCALDIYDRNYGKDNPAYQFPEKYEPYIAGSLPFSEIEQAYKGYKYAINLNSIKQSQSMFARRAFELLASNTLTISNFSRGIRLLFGDLIIASDSGEEVINRLKLLSELPEGEDKLRLLGLRKVMQEHTYMDRLNYIISKVENIPFNFSLPKFSVFSMVESLSDVNTVIEYVQSQNCVSVSLKLVVSKGLSFQVAKNRLDQSGLVGSVFEKSDLVNHSLSAIADENSWCAVFLPKDFYGPNYLLDIALATRYSQAQVIGKASYYRIKKNALKLVDSELSYRSVITLPVRASAVSPVVAETVNAASWLSSLYKGEYSYSAQLSIDRFNYCRDGSSEACMGDESIVRRTVLDMQIDNGIAVDKLLSIAEGIAPLAKDVESAQAILPSQLSELLNGTRNVELSLTEEGLKLASKLGDGQHEYLYANREFTKDELLNSIENNVLPIHFDLEPGLNVSFVILFLDEGKQRISHEILKTNANHSIDIPIEAVYFRFGLRVYAGGLATVKNITFSHKDLQPAYLYAKSDVLLVTNNYPSYQDLYRNGFVHSRVRAYRESGVSIDVFRLRKNQPVSWHEFQSVDVTTGSQEALEILLSSGQYRSVLVHFLDEEMWQVLSKFIDKIKVIVWLHGAEIHPWYRRKYNLETDEQVKLAKVDSERRMAFWSRLLKPMPKNMSLVFVSKSFYEEVEEDLGFKPEESQYSIIHNPIDTDRFPYIKKNVEQRKRVLSIRPFASKQYANDLSVAVVLELAKQPFFNDLEFLFVGDGKLFESTVEPLRKFKNVKLEKRFLQQEEISALHKEYGLFLCPTRWDSQGVSRDEAMSSGLVPVTNSVAAIPEFVDEASGILSGSEDFKSLAEGIAKIYFDPILFEKMSIAAAANVRLTRCKDGIIHREIGLWK